MRFASALLFLTLLWSSAAAQDVPQPKHPRLLLDEQVKAAWKKQGATAGTAVTLYRDREDLISIGAYASGSDPRVDHAITMVPRIDRFLRQGIGEHVGAEDADAQLLELIHGGAPVGALALAPG